jgi:hypothetical protein
MRTWVLELYEALRKAGVDEMPARDAASAVFPVDCLDDLATKHDLSELRLAVNADISELRLALKADISELRLAAKADISELGLTVKADMSEMKAELIKWNIGTMVALTALCVAIMRLL